VSGPERTFLERVKTMFMRATRTEGRRVQTVLVASTMPSQGTKSTRMLVGRWMPHALRALPRPDLLHRNHPMVLQSWKYVPEGFDEKVKLLVDYMRQYSDQVRVEPEATSMRGRWKHAKHRKKQLKYRLREKTIVYCNMGTTAVALAELLATTHHFHEVGLFVSAIGYDERRERMQMFRDGRIRLMVCTDILSRGVDIPDVGRVVQFDFSRNVVGHIHRIGRVSRAGTRGYALNMYDDSEQGGRALAEAVQEIGTRPLDGLFSRNRGFKRGLRRTEAFRQMLLTQGLPLPPHLQDSSEDAPAALPSSETAALKAGSDQKSVPDLQQALQGTEEPEELEDSLLGEKTEEELEELFEKTDEEKDEEYVNLLEELDEQRQQREDAPTGDSEEADEAVGKGTKEVGRAAS